MTKATGILGILTTLLGTREAAGNSVSVTTSSGGCNAKSFVNASVLIPALTICLPLSLFSFFSPSHSPAGLFLALSLLAALSSTDSPGASPSHLAPGTWNPSEPKSLLLGAKRKETAKNKQKRNSLACEGNTPHYPPHPASAEPSLQPPGSLLSCIRLLKELKPQDWRNKLYLSSWSGGGTALHQHCHLSHPSWSRGQGSAAAEADLSCRKKPMACVLACQSSRPTLRPPLEHILRANVLFFFCTECGTAWRN